jgi:hypothetical protein
MYKVKLPPSIKTDSQSTLVAKLLMFDIAAPKPREITQIERQFVFFSGNVSFPSPYPTGDDKLFVHIHTGQLISISPNLEFRSDAELCSASSSNVKFGSFDTFFVHFFCPSWFLAVPEYEREVIVSSLAPSRVQERYTVRNTGAALKGELNGYRNLA